MLCRLLLCRRRRRRQSHRSRRFCSSEWDIFNNFPPNVPNLVLPHLFCRCPHPPAYMLPSSSAADPIISHQLPLSPLTPPSPPAEYTPPPRLRWACKSICVAPRPTNEADTTTTAYPIAADISLCLRERIHHRNGHWRLMMRRVNCVAINPCAEVEQNIFHLLPFLSIPVVPILLPCIPLPTLYLASS